MLQNDEYWQAKQKEKLERTQWIETVVDHLPGQWNVPEVLPEFGYADRINANGEKLNLRFNFNKYPGRCEISPVLFSEYTEISGDVKRIYPGQLGLTPISTTLNVSRKPALIARQIENRVIKAAEKIKLELDMRAADWTKHNRDNLRALEKLMDAAQVKANRVREHMSFFVSGLKDGPLITYNGQNNVQIELTADEVIEVIKMLRSKRRIPK